MPHKIAKRKYRCTKIIGIVPNNNASTDTDGGYIFYITLGGSFKRLYSSENLERTNKTLPIAINPKYPESSIIKIPKKAALVEIYWARINFKSRFK